MVNDTIDAIEDLLETERRAILSGEFDLLNRIAHRRTDLFHRLSEKRHNHSKDLVAIAARLTANQALLSAAITGVSDASNQILQKQKSLKTLVIYDGKGKKTEAGFGVSGFERRI